METKDPRNCDNCNLNGSGVCFYDGNPHGYSDSIINNVFWCPRYVPIINNFQPNLSLKEFMEKEGISTEIMD